MKNYERKVQIGAQPNDDRFKILMETTEAAQLCRNYNSLAEHFGAVELMPMYLQSCTDTL